MIKSRFLQEDKTEKVHTTPRQEGTSLYYTGAFDDITNNKIGEGETIAIQNTFSSSKVIVEGYFTEDIFIKDGVLFWTNAAIGDEVTFSIVLPAGVPHYVGLNGNCNIVNGEVILVEDWSGDHIITPEDYVVHRFLNRIPILDSNPYGLSLDSNDVARMSKELKFRLTLTSKTKNENICISVLMGMYRENTV
jgi:hypothetical protein